MVTFQGEAMEADQYEAIIRMRLVRHKKSFMFLLCADFLWFCMLFFVDTMGGGSGDGTEANDPLYPPPYSDGSYLGSGSGFAYTAVAMPSTVALIINLCVDFIGMLGSSRNSLVLMTVFIVVQGISIGIYTFSAFSPHIIIRLVIFLVSFCVLGT